MALYKLALAAERSGYSAVAGESTKRRAVAGGRSRFRRDMIGARTGVSVQWQLDAGEYDYLLSFYRAATDGGALPFLIDLLMDGPFVAEYEASFASGPPSLVGVSGETFTIRATLEVKPTARDPVADAALVATLDDGTAGYPRLALTPSKASYSEDKGVTALRVSLNSGPSRRRKDVEGNVALVDVQWRVSPSLFGYLQAFYWTTTMEGSLPFRIDLQLAGPEVLPHVAFFMPGSFGLAGVSGLTHIVRAQVEAKPLATDSEYDLALIMTTDAYGEEGAAVYAALAELVNVTMPDAMG